MQWDAKVKVMAAAPPGWIAVIGEERCPVAMFCECHWYNSGERSGIGTIVVYRGRMQLAELLSGFKRIEPPYLPEVPPLG